MRLNRVRDIVMMGRLQDMCGPRTWLKVCNTWRDGLEITGGEMEPGMNRGGGTIGLIIVKWYRLLEYACNASWNDRA